MQVLNIIVGLFRNSAMFISLIALLGLVLQRKSASDVIKGTFKTFIGMVILTQGVNIISTAIQPLSTAFVELFSIQGTADIGDFSAFLEIHGTEVGIIMLIGFVLNILIARFTKFKTIFLTANILYWYPMLFLAVGIENELTRWATYILAGIFYILVIIIFPHLLRPHVKNLTGSDNFTIGHTTSIYCLLGVGVGKLFAKKEENKEQNLEHLKLPASLDFLKDTTLVAGILITLVYLVVLLCVGADLRTEILAGSDVVSFSLINGMTFAAGMLIMLQGVRMMLAEIVPAFKGIASKLAPGSVPAMDIPLIFPYGANSLLIGFIIAIATNVLSIVVLGISGILTVPIIPLVIACYFDVAPGAIFANKIGGAKAAIVTALLGGIIMTLLVAFTIPMVSHKVGVFHQTYGGNDYSLWTALATGVAKLFSIFGL